MPHGKLTVVVQSATGIKDPTLHRKGDSYCTLQCGSQVLCTHVCEGGSSHPVFHTEFEFEIDRSTNELAVSVYSKCDGREDELIGFTELKFKQVFYHGHTVALTAYALSQPSGKAGGCINISLKFKSRRSPYVQNGHAPVRQHSAPPHGAPRHHHPQGFRNQHNPVRQSYPNGPDGYDNFEDGYGSSGSESSMSSRGSSKYSRSQSQPEHYYREDYENSTSQDEYYRTPPPPPPPPQAHYNQPRPSPLRPNPGPRRRAAVSGGGGGPRQPIPGGPELHFANPYPHQQPRPQVQVYCQPPPQRPVRPHMATRPQQQIRVPQGQEVYRPQQEQFVAPEQQGPSAGTQIAQAVAVGVAKAGVRAIVGGLFG